jgi:hypothetical protein
LTAVSPHWSSILTLLALTLLANGLPALLGFLLGPSRPLDRGRTLADGQRLLGASKTWRGLVAALIGTGFGGVVLGIPWVLGLLIGLGAVLGDLVTSFVKRRLRLAPSSTVPVLDQVPEALVPALLAKAELNLSWPDVVIVVLIFCILGLVLTPLGRRLFGPRLRG